MKRKVIIDSGVIGGYEKELIEDILPKLSDSFRQRKQYWEYYFTETEVELTLQELDTLSKDFTIELSFDELKIKL